MSVAQEFPDPLASWEDLEPDFNHRRSRHIDRQETNHQWYSVYMARP